MSRSRRKEPYITKRGSRAKGKILLAGGKVFAAKGYEASTIRDIAKEAGSDAASVMRYFGTKDDLYIAVIKNFIVESGRWDYIFGPLWTDKKVTPALLEKILGECINRYMYQHRPGEPDFENRLGFRLVTDDVPLTQEMVLSSLSKTHERMSEVLRQAYPKLTDEQILDWRSAFYGLLLYPNVLCRVICHHNGWQEIPLDYYKRYAEKMTADCCALLRAKVK